MQLSLTPFPVESREIPSSASDLSLTLDEVVDAGVDGGELLFDETLDA